MNGPMSFGPSDRDLGLTDEEAPSSNLRTHDLKCWPPFFASLLDGSKTFEIRWDDRNFRVGDTLHIREYNPETQTYTGAEVHRRVTYIFNSGNRFGLQPGWAVLGLAHETSAEPDWKHRAEEAEGILSDNMALANRTTRRAMDERNGIIRKLRERYSAIEIADMAGLTRQRVHQILNEAPVEGSVHGQQDETSVEQKYSEKDIAAITAAIDAAREAKAVTGVCVGGRASLGGNDIMLLKVPSGSYGIGVRYAIRAVKSSGEAQS